MRNLNLKNHLDFSSAFSRAAANMFFSLYDYVLDLASASAWAYISDISPDPLKVFMA